MKTRNEIERVHDGLANNRESTDRMGDNFKAGLYVGKLLALGWVLGDVQGSSIAIDHDYESWMREAEFDSEDPEGLGGGET